MEQKEIFEREYEKLNTKQKEAVETLDGAVMVVAWPWTGKTQIIGMRTANIIQHFVKDLSTSLHFARDDKKVHLNWGGLRERKKL